MMRKNTWLRGSGELERGRSCWEQHCSKSQVSNPGLWAGSGAWKMSSPLCAVLTVIFSANHLTKLHQAAAFTARHTSKHCTPILGWKQATDWCDFVRRSDWKIGEDDFMKKLEGKIIVRTVFGSRFHSETHRVCGQMLRLGLENAHTHTPPGNLWFSISTGILGTKSPGTALMFHKQKHFLELILSKSKNGIKHTEITTCGKILTATGSFRFCVTRLAKMRFCIWNN